MDVHHHTHSTPKVVEGKKWTHFIWEFLMLFLAVFCGFLAENFREHHVEKERGHQLIEAFYNDLKRDTASYSRIIIFDQQKIDALKNIFSCYDTINSNWKSSTCLVEIVKQSMFNNAMQFNDGTLQQFKNAGGYRLISSEDRDSINSYDNHIKRYKDFEGTLFQETQENLRQTYESIGDFQANRFLRPGVAGADSSKIIKPFLISGNKELINKCFNQLFRYKAVISTQKANLTDFRSQAIRLMEYFSNKYNLE